MLIGIAGHIDHGKTSLLKALTGTDADRLPQEKQQGITVDLGYAYLPLENGSVLGFVDVPGHEKLVHNMLAGATGIDFVLLVIAADDGPMPQTREHLELLELLGMQRGVVALNKIDAVDEARLATAREEVLALLADGPLAGSPVFPVSARSGEGISALLAHLLDIAGQVAPISAGSRFRLPLDRSFSLPGIGTVVTGTIHAGEVHTGDTLLLAPSGLRARVHSLRVQDQPAQSGHVGQRCALVLRGDFSHKDLHRGHWLIDPLLDIPVQRFQARVQVPARQPALRHQQVVHVHAGTDDLMGKLTVLEGRQIGAGNSGLVEVILQRETRLLQGDHFILRDAGAQRTVAGGDILDIFPPARHKRTPQRLALLEAFSRLDPQHALREQAAAAVYGMDLQRFYLSWNLSESRARQLCGELGLHLFEDDRQLLGMTPDNYRRLADDLLARLAAEHESASDMPGVEEGRLRRMVSVHLQPLIFSTLLADLLAQGRLQRTRSWLHLPEHRASLGEADQKQFAAIKPLLDASPYNPPRVRDLARMLEMPEYEMRRLCKRLARAGELYPVARDHYFTAASVAELAALIRHFNATEGAARVAPMRDQLFPEGGGGRKIIVRILEFFNRIGYTRRIQDDHVLRDGVEQAWLS